jgi:hypothetical protein
MISLKGALRARQLDDPVPRFTKRDVADQGGDLVGRNRLKQARRYPDDAAARTRIRNAAEEF